MWRHLSQLKQMLKVFGHGFTIHIQMWQELILDKNRRGILNTGNLPIIT